MSELTGEELDDEFSEESSEEFDEKKLTKENDEALDIFENYLVNKGLTDKTIGKHIFNLDMFLNTYLVCYEEKTYKDGYKNIGMYLGYFFIRKCMWSSPNTIKTTAASIKKFYKCMLENNLVDANCYEWICEVIKEELKNWQDTCYRFYNFDWSSDEPFEW